MGANINPIFPVTPVIGYGTLTTANTAKNGTGTVVTVFTAGLNGARVDSLKVRGLGTNVQTVLRIFINNGSDPTIATNNTLVMERTIPATTLSETTELADMSIPLDFALPNGYKVNLTIGTTVSAGVQVTCFGGAY